MERLERTYNELLNRLKEAEASKTFEHNLLTAQRLLKHLMDALNLEAGEVASNLFRVYDFMHDQLVEANLSRNTEAVRQVRQLVLQLKRHFHSI